MNRLSPRSRKVLSLVVATLVAALAASVSAETPRRIVAVGDAHGSLDGLQSILGEAGLIDDEARWTGGDTILIQLGDRLDRGAEVRAVMDLLMRLQEEAPSAGGQVICLLGNHEVMNLLGIRRDINPEAYRGFVDERSEARQKEAYEAFVRNRKRLSRFFDQPPPTFDDATRRRWMESFPLGAVEYVEALGPEGRYGRWLRESPIAARLGETLFIHGGVSPAMRGRDVEAVNQQASEELAAFDRFRDYMVEHDLALSTDPVTAMARVVEQLADAAGTRRDHRRRAHLDRLDDLRRWRSWSLDAADGPLWFRGAANWDEDTHGEEMAALLDGVGVRRMVVGHSVTRTHRVTSRFNDRVFLIDTGMLAERYQGGRPSALEITAEAVTAIYLDSRETLLELGPRTTAAVWLDPDGQPLPFRTLDEATEFLRTATVVSTEKIDRGVTEPRKILLERDGVRAHAVFKDVDRVLKRGAASHRGKAFLEYRDYHLYECAAFELDRMLGLNRVPPAVPRTVNGRKGTLQLWMEATIMDVERRNLGLEPPSRVRWDQQRQIMQVFDNLVGNTDANLGNLLIDRSWRLWFIDHTRSFVRAKSLLYPARVSRSERHLWEALLALDEDQVRRRLDPFLSIFEINAVLARREALIERIQGLIERLGAPAIVFELPQHEGPLAEWPE